ncbi:MAG: hypothetical protein SGPRY_000041 [Prymnesium sp.]
MPQSDPIRAARISLQVETDEATYTTGINAPSEKLGTNRSESSRLQSARARLKQALDEVEGIIQPSGSYWVPEPSYDPLQAAELFKHKPRMVAQRQMQLLGPLFNFLARVVLDQQAGNEAAHRQQRASELREIISNLGPAIIKAGQALSSRSDLLPAEYLTELSKLQDRVPPFATSEAFAIIEAELGGPMHEFYTNIDDTPVAAASLGQVYKAELLDGTPVAIKVQRPGAEPTIALDLYILRSYSRTLTSLISLLGRQAMQSAWLDYYYASDHLPTSLLLALQIDLVSVIDDFGTLIYSEIDYSIEAASARRFVSLYGSIANVTAPQIFTSQSTRKVLTMEWIDGVRLTDREALLRMGLEPARLVDTLVQCTLRQASRNGFFHADPHGGNLLVTADGQLTYIDFGMMSFVAPHQRLACSSRLDIHRSNQVLGFIPPEEDTRPIASALNDALPDVLNSSVAEFNFKSVVDKLGDVMYTYPFSLPPFYIAVIRCLGVLEGVALQVDQDFAIIKDAYPFVASRLLTDRSPQLQNALRQLIFQDNEVSHFPSLLASQVKDSAIPNLAGYLLSEEGEPLLNALSDRLVEELDVLGADSAVFTYSAIVSLGRQLAQSSVSGAGETLGIGNATASGGGRSDAFLEAALGTVSTTLSAIGSGKWELAATSFEELAEEKMSTRMRQAVRWLGLLQQSSKDGADLTRVGTLLGTLLSQRKVQQQLVDISLQVVERGIMRGIRFAFGVGPHSKHSSDP